MLHPDKKHSPVKKHFIKSQMKTLINLKGFKISYKICFFLIGKALSVLEIQHLDIFPAYFEDELEQPQFEIINVTIKQDGKFHLYEIET